MKTFSFTQRLFVCLSLVLVLASPAWGLAPEKAKKIQIVFIGNSISAGAQLSDAKNMAPPARTCAFLRTQAGIGEVIEANVSVSGKTTADYLPAFNSMYPRILAAADELAKDETAQLIFSVMLGTNDSAIKGPNGAPTSPQQYQSNLNLILDRLLERYPKSIVVLHRPTWYSPNTYNNGAMYLQEGLNRLEKYGPELHKLVDYYATTNPNHVFMGDESAFEFFRDHAEAYFNHERGNAGTFYLHPNQEGADILGKYWGEAIYKVIR